MCVCVQRVKKYRTFLFMVSRVILSYANDWKVQNVEKSFLNKITFHSFLTTNNDDATHRVSFMKNLPLSELPARPSYRSIYSIASLIPLISH